MKIALVYQAGIANVFRVDCLNMNKHGRNAKRIMQGTFRDCEHFCRGVEYTGAIVISCQCNEAGDISEAKWKDSLEDAPFRDKMNPVWNTTMFRN